MARAVRYVRNDHYYFITNRCLLGQFLMLPDEECQRIIRGVLARAADECDVELVCFVFLSNHFHLVARFPRCNRSDFMCRLEGQIADRLNDERGRSGTVFPVRYDAQAILDEETLRDKIAYTLNNPVQDRLVASAEQWPGVTSMELHYKDEPLKGSWVDYTHLRQLRRQKGETERDDAAIEYDIELHYPAELGGEWREERRQSLIELVESERDRLHRTWSTSPHRGEGVLGAEAICEQFDWWDIPEKPPDWSGRRHLGVASSAERMADYHDERRTITKLYRRASNAWPDCRLEDFPEGTHPPSCRHCVGAPADP